MLNDQEKTNLPKKYIALFLENIFIRILFGPHRENYKVVYYVLMVGFYKELHITCYISPRSSIRNYKNISLGRNCIVNDNVALWGHLKTGNNIQLNPGTCVYGNVAIGNDVMIAPNVMIAGGNHSIICNDIPMISQAVNGQLN